LTATAKEGEMRPLKRTSLWLMVVLFIITFTLYMPIWYLRRRAGLNALDSPKKLARWPFIAFFIVSIIYAFVPPSLAARSDVSWTLLVMRLAIGIVMIVQAFRIKDIIEDHAAKPADDTGVGMSRYAYVHLSGLATLFLTIFYLQYAINKYIAPNADAGNAV
jgi:uncharacterized membrane protein